MPDDTNTRTYPAIIAVLVVIVAAMGYRFIVAGSTETGDDRRVALDLAPAEGTLMLREMRGFVAGRQPLPTRRRETT